MRAGAIAQSDRRKFNHAKIFSQRKRRFQMNHKRIDFNKPDNAVLLIALTIAVVWLGYYHWRLVVYPFPVEHREGAMMVTTHLLRQGKNPYDLAYQPAATQVYGIIYPLIVLPFTLLFGETLLVYRSVAGVCILVACYLCYKLIRQAGISPILAGIGTAIFYAYCLYNSGYASPPNGLGLALFLACIFLPHRFSFSTPSIIGSAIFGVLAFLSKPYFVLAIPYIALYLLLFQSLKLSVRYIATVCAVLIPTLLFIQVQYPYYFYNSILIHASVAGNSLHHLWLQLVDYVKSSPGITLITLYGLFAYGYTIVQSKNNLTAKIFDVASSFKDQNVFYCCLSIFLFCAKLGQHPGNYLTYWLHLGAPFLIIVALSTLR